MPNIHLTAAGAGEQFLYHYQKFNPFHLKTILKEQKIYCSDTKSMNDPWDFRPAFDWQLMVIDPGNLASMFVKSYAPKLPIKRANRAFNKYKLEII